MKTIPSLLPGLNNILKVREAIGADLKAVSIVVRTWSGTEIGDGTSDDVVTAVTPSPRVVDFSHKAVIDSGGAIESGDIIVKHISKATFPLKSSIDCESSSDNIEKFYSVGEFSYRVIKVHEDHLTWSVHLRKIST